MKRQNHTSHTRHHSRLPPVEALGQGVVNLARPFSDHCHLEYAGRSRNETREVGLTLVPPTRYRSILVPVNGSPFGEHALPLALGIARRTGANLRVVNVHSPLQSSYRPETLYSDGVLDGWGRQYQQVYMDGLCRRLARATSVPVTPVFMRGEITESLAAESTGADLVVMATHGRGPLGRLWWGSVADTLMQRLSVPLLLVRGYYAPVDLTGDPLIRNVLIPLDGSKLAEQILEPALALGTLTDANHTLLGVTPSERDYSLGYPGTVPQRPVMHTQQAEAWSYLRGIVDRLRGRKHRVHPRLALTEMSIAKAILSCARTYDADLIALATRGHGGLTRLFRGSVAERVIRGASAPVLVLRPDA